MTYKAKGNFLLKTIAGESVLTARGKDAIDFGGMIIFNEAGLYMWKALEEGCTAQSLSEKLAAQYEIPAAQAQADADAFLEKCMSEGLLDKTED